MIEIKPGVRVFGLRPEILLAVQVAEGLWAEHGTPTLVITAVIDGTHKRQSFHYSGVGVDFRINTVPGAQRPSLLKRLHDALGPDYVVIHEAKGLPEEHVHVHFLPAEAY